MTNKGPAPCPVRPPTLAQSAWAARLYSNKLLVRSLVPICCYKIERSQLKFSSSAISLGCPHLHQAFASHCNPRIRITVPSYTRHLHQSSPLHHVYLYPPPNQVSPACPLIPGIPEWCPPNQLCLDCPLTSGVTHSQHPPSHPYTCQ